jgi:hypothetical protein
MMRSVQTTKDNPSSVQQVLSTVGKSIKQDFFSRYLTDQHMLMREQITSVMTEKQSPIETNSCSSCRKTSSSTTVNGCSGIRVVIVFCRINSFIEFCLFSSSSAR